MNWLRTKNYLRLLVTSLAICLAGQTKAATYTDSQNLAELTVLPTVSSVTGFVAWQFSITPLNATQEVSSIDAASGNNGFSGEAFRQVNPDGQPTVFSDLNGLFGAGEDASTDTQFSFLSGSLLVAPNSAAESSTQLNATFTGFTPVLVDTGPTVFAQVVTSIGLGGTFRGSFALRPLSGGTPEAATFASILFGSTAGDFDSNGFTDATDLAILSNGLGVDATGDTNGDGDTDGADFLTWQRNFTGGTGTIAVSVPEPSSLGLLVLSVLLACSRSKSHF